MDLPKYVRTMKGNALYYDRAVPTRLHGLSTERRIRIPLGLQSDAPPKTIERAALDASEEYDARIALLDASDVHMLQDDVVAHNVAALLRNLQVEPGMPQVRMVNIDGSELDDESMRGQGMFADDGSFHYVGTEEESPDYAAAVDSMVKTVQAVNILHEVEAHPIVKEAAKKALIKGMGKKRKRISDLWAAWFNDVMAEKSEREQKRYQRYGTDLLVLTGDHHVDAPDALDHIHRGMDEYVELKLSEGKGKPGIEKALNLWCAAMRRGSKTNRLRWLIEPPSLSHIKHKVKPKGTLDDEQQKTLLENAGCLEGALMLLELQTACMQSEVASLNLKKALKSLKHSTPYLLFNEDTEGKTEVRRRVSPVTVQPEIIAKWLPEIHEWLNSVTESAVSARLSAWLSDLYGTHLTPHGAGRHTFKATAMAVAANPMHVAMIAGWSTGGVSLSDHMSRYGRAAIEKSEQLRALSETSRLMFANLVDEAPANVVPLKKPKKKPAKTRRG